MTFYVRFTNEYIEDGFDGDGLPIEIWKVTATPLSAESAASTQGILRVDVSSMSYAPSEDGPFNDIIFHGPRPPVPGEWGEYTDPDSSGITNARGWSRLVEEEYFSNTTIILSINFDWPAEFPRGAFIIEYEAEAELLYASSDYYGNPILWMFGDGESNSIEFNSRQSKGLGVTAFKIYTPGDGAPQEPFWTDVLGCTELA